MTAFVDVSFIVGATYNIRVGTLNLDTGALTKVSPEAPTMRSFDQANPGTRLADGRYVFGSSIEGDTGSLRLFILDAARTTWTTLETDVDLSGFNDLQAPILDAGEGFVMVSFRAVTPTRSKETACIDLATGLSSRYTLWGTEVDDEVYLFEAPSKTDDGWVLATTESEYIYRVDPLTGSGGIWVNVGDEAPGADVDLTGAAYHSKRASVFAWGIGPGGSPRDHYVREYAYPSGALANNWGPFTIEPASFAANAAAIDDYYVFADASVGAVGVFRPSTGTPITLPVVLDSSLAAIGAADSVLVIPNTGSIGVPPQRIFPRDDGLGMSTKRSWPPSVSRQSGHRSGPVATYL